MKKPPFHHLRSGRIVPKFRRHIGIFPGKAVQIKKGFHICGPEIIVVPPAHHFSADAYCDNHRHGNGRYRASLQKLPGTETGKLLSFFPGYPKHINGGKNKPHNRQNIRKCKMPRKTEDIKAQNQKAAPHRNAFHKPDFKPPCNCQYENQKSRCLN